MDGIEIKKYTAKKSKRISKRNTKNYNKELKQLYRIDVNHYKLKTIQQKPKKQCQKREKNIINKLISAEDDYNLNLVDIYINKKFQNYEFNFKLNINKNVNNLNVLHNAVNTAFEEIERFCKLKKYKY